MAVREEDNSFLLSSKGNKKKSIVALSAKIRTRRLRLQWLPWYHNNGFLQTARRKMPAIVLIASRKDTELINGLFLLHRLGSRFYKNVWKARILFPTLGIRAHFGDGLHIIGTHSTLCSPPQPGLQLLNTSIVLVQYNRQDFHQADRPRKSRARRTMDDLKRRTSTTDVDPLRKNKECLHNWDYHLHLWCLHYLK